jgi:hypothetical protein
VKYTYVVMVQCAKDDVDILIKLIGNMDEEENVVLFPWKQYVPMSLEKKQTMYNDIRLWNYSYKSIVIDGFVDNTDNIQIRNNNLLENNSNEETISVSELRNIINPTNNEGMIEYVYPTINCKSGNQPIR